MKFQNTGFSRRLATCFAALSLFVSVLAASVPINASWREPVRGKNAMVVADQEIASKVGVEILKKGGNAVDAAIAVGLALAVVFPEAGNIGGGGFMMIRTKDGAAHAIDYREMAPGAASRDIYVDKNGKLITGEGSSLIGYRASGVPGTLAGFEIAFKKYGSGKLTWRELVEPARLLAVKGFRLESWQAGDLGSPRSVLAKNDESKRIFQNNGKYLAEGDLLAQPELAQTLGRVQRLGAREFYSGLTAKMIAADMKAHNGLITLDDLKNYQAKERTPLIGNYRGHQIITMPPPSSGGVVILQILNMLEAYDVRAMEYNSAAKYQVMTEAMRRGFADRAVYMGDPDFFAFPVAPLIDKKYAEKRGATIDLVKATPSSTIGPGEVPGYESMQTTNYTVVDSAGNIVVNTYTLNNGFGSGVTIKGTGILMNNEMDDFAAQPGKPNGFGLIQGERNSVQPRKRPLSSMTPTIVLRKDGTPWFGLGAQGGPTIISAILQGIVNVIDHQMNIQQAIDAPRIHHQWYPDQILYEPFGISPDTKKLLESYGQKFVGRPQYFAGATAIMIGEDGVRLGAEDSRSPGAAVGY